MRMEAAIEHLMATVTAPTTAAADVDALIQVTQPVEAVDLLGWLAAQRATTKLFWAERDTPWMMAGIGTADVVSAENGDTLTTLFQKVQQHRYRYFGGLCFDESQPVGDEWRHFGRFWFAIPRIALIQTEQETSLQCTFRPAEAESVVAALQAVTVDGCDLPCAPLPAATQRHDLPDANGWSANIAAALDTFAAGDAHKIVLARRSCLALDTPPDPIALTHHLHTTDPNSFRFCFQLHEGSAFFGATPERLYQRQGHMLYSEALAGTRRRGHDFIEDRKFRKELLYNEKERREHILVQQAILDGLEPLAVSATASPHVTVKVLEKVQHRFNTIQAILQAGVTDADLIAALHPTPAVGGLPRPVAVERIAALEPFDRGWYAAPVGWIDQHSAEFAVAIRSALVDEQRLNLYAGAGIVSGAVAEYEWKELDNKLGNFRAILP